MNYPRRNRESEGGKKERERKKERKKERERERERKKEVANISNVQHPGISWCRNKPSYQILTFGTNFINGFHHK